MMLLYMRPLAVVLYRESTPRPSYTGGGGGEEGRGGGRGVSSISVARAMCSQALQIVQQSC